MREYSPSRAGVKGSLARALMLALSVGAVGPCWIPTIAADSQIFVLRSREAFLRGTLEGIGVDSLGTLQLADRAERLVEVDEPFLLSAAAAEDGWVLGTGNAGKVLRVTAGGEVVPLFAATEPEIFAVWVDDDGSVFAGSSPNGKVYRLDGAGVEVYFEPGETYIWGLAQAATGELLVATGTQGKLYKVSAKGRGEVLFDSEDTHLRTIKVLPSGEILLGTAGEGLILKLSADGRARTLLDANQPEVVAFAAAPDGACYAALLASEASQVNLVKGRAAGQGDQGQEQNRQGEGDEEGEEGSEEVTVTVDLTSELQEAPTGSRPPGYIGPRSEVVRISPEGVVESLARFEQETVHSLLWSRDRLWIGTGLEGKIFSLTDHRPVLEQDVDERQVIALVEDSPGPAFGTTNAAAFYRLGGQRARRGIYTSPTLDAEQIARFGILRWQGRLPAGARLSFAFRSGMSSSPDRTWSAWTTAASGREISLADLQAGRYLQWRAELEATDDGAPSVSEVTISYLQANLPPRIVSLQVLDPGQILVPANFNPAQQIYEPAHPNREGIFTTIEPATAEEGRRLKTLWKRGFRTFRWEARDPNGDELVFDLAFRPEQDDGDWLPVVDDLREDHYSFDATALPDGRYRFRLRAADRLRQEDEERRESLEISEPVLIDHSVPKLEAVGRRSGFLEVDVEDLWNPLREAVYSIDAKEWVPATAADGLLDGQRETLLIPASREKGLVLLRVTDAAFNVVTFDLSQGGGS